MSNKLFVGNLAFSVTEEELRDTFKTYGGVEEVKIILDRESGRSRGFAFVTFNVAENADAALAMDGQELSGRNIHVKIAEQRSDNRHDGGRRGDRDGGRRGDRDGGRRGDRDGGRRDRDGGYRDREAGYRDRGSREDGRR